MSPRTLTQALYSAHSLQRRPHTSLLVDFPFLVWSSIYPSHKYFILAFEFVLEFVFKRSSFIPIVFLDWSLARFKGIMIVIRLVCRPFCHADNQVSCDRNRD